MAPRKHRRVNHRVPASLHLAYASGERSYFDGVVTDISAGGVHVILRTSGTERIERGSRAQITIRRADGNHIQMGGEVVRGACDLNGIHDIALQFDRAHYDSVVDLTAHESVTVDLNTFAVWNPYREMLGQPS